VTDASLACLCESSVSHSRRLMLFIMLPPVAVLFMSALCFVCSADFGFARFLESGVMAGTLCGSPMYMVHFSVSSLTACSIDRCYYCHYWCLDGECTSHLLCSAQFCAW